MEAYAKRFHELTPAQLYAVLRLRAEVFVLEQGCPLPELDGRDPAALHVWLEEGGEVLAALRVLDRGVESAYVSMGRVAVARGSRGRGLGARVMAEGVRAAREIFSAGEIYVESQLQARGFYEKLGFRPMGEPFETGWVPHVPLLLDAPPEG